MVTLDREQILRIIHEPGDTTYLTHNFHPYAAKFIPQLPAYLIRTLSSENDTVLDPFAGSGTTLKVARELGRNSIGYEINPEFESLIREKVQSLEHGDDDTFQFIKSQT